ncbi:unnamed protein product [Ceratitis capitata]|uniref:(Mediterranean fruit fly) hypothetical protein n=1 Tax=Ceratitis capitata TaxID=7213 RepID=A0A811UD21_CERCA|nr:unnamed protein product [Ceratitis capitata]
MESLSNNLGNIIFEKDKNISLLIKYSFDIKISYRHVSNCCHIADALKRDDDVAVSATAADFTAVNDCGIALLETALYYISHVCLEVVRARSSTQNAPTTTAIKLLKVLNNNHRPTIAKLQHS